MYCFRCGKKLPGREINCPDCDTPQKKRRRKHKRMLLGLFIFLSGAVVGSLFDTYIFKGDIWKHSFFNTLFSSNNNNLSNKADQSQKKENNVTVKMKYSNSEPTTIENITNSPKKEETIKEPTEIKKNNNEALENNPVPTINEKTVKDISENKIDIESKIIDTVSEDNSLISSGIDSAVIVNDASETVLTQAVKKDELTIKENLESSQDGDDTNENSEEIIILEDHDDDLNNENTASDTNVAKIDVEEQKLSETFPQGNLVYKNIQLIEQSNRDSYHGFMSRNGKELVFASNRYDYKGKPTFQCFIKEASGNSKSTKAFDWKGNVWTPELTPDSNMIVFSSDSSQGIEHIFLYDRKSKNSIALTSGKSKDMMPTISPDGKKIAFVSNRSGKNCIYVCDLFNSSKVTQVTKAKVDDREPRWSPDGKSIIFTRIIERMKTSHIMKVNIDPVGEPVALVDSKSRNWMADISPDNKLLAFTRSLSDNGSKNVIVLKDISSGKEEILNFAGISESIRPVWNADCSGFIFHIRKANGSCIYKANFARE